MIRAYSSIQAVQAMGTTSHRGQWTWSAQWSGYWNHNDLHSHRARL